MSRKTSGAPYAPPTPPSPLPIDVPWPLLGGISPAKFMKQYWQKKPLLVRGAIPAFGLASAFDTPLSSPIPPAELFKLAGSKNVESRLVKHSPSWSLRHGPFQNRDIPSLTDKNWTLLVQGVNGHHVAAQTVMSWFRFIPQARLDDVMISIAGPGGGVGPHQDSYDVFLIQMSGRRRWRIAQQKDNRLVDGLPVKILKNFRPEEDWVLEPGDMLYLPPNIAHDGIALDAGCQTWSVGFRVPTYSELINEILWRTQEVLESDPKLKRLYSDPHQVAVEDAGRVPKQLIDELHHKLSKIRWSKSDISCTLAGVMSEPKPQTTFEAPRTPLDLTRFRREMTTRGIQLSPGSRLLHDGEFAYLNGEFASDNQAPDWRYWQELSKNQTVKPALAAQLARLLNETDNPWYEGYLAGWLALG